MTTKPTTQIEQLVLLAAKTAGTHARKFAFDIGELEFKKENDPVTNLDREAEQIVADTFDGTGYNHIGEEFGIIDRGHKYSVMTDPIDGTKSYTFGDFHTSTVVMVFDEEAKEPIASAVYDFMKGVTYAANETEAYILTPTNEKLLLPRQFPNYTINRMLSNEPTDAPKWMSTKPNRLYQQNGSFALSLAQVATGSYDAFYSPPFEKDGRHDLGDIIAGVHILDKAGYKVTDADGHKLDYMTMDNGLLAVRGDLLP